MTLGANPYSDIPFPDPVCKNHPDRHPVEPMAFRHCAECKAEAQARYAEQRGSFSIRPQDERSTDGRYIMDDHKGHYRTTESERNDV